MAVNYQVNAQVVDLRSDSPRSTDLFLVDSNVWFWTAYANAPYASPAPQAYQSRDYPDYLQRVLKCGGHLHWCGLSLSELAHRIECTEFDIAKNYGGTTATNLKEYRHNDVAERARVVGEISATWSDIEAMAASLPTPIAIDANTVKQALLELPAVGLDAYDLFLLQSLRSAGITGIISDDGDFSTAAGIIMFTANRTVINAANAQRRLLVR